MVPQSETSSVDAAPTRVTSNKVWFITGASRGFGRVWTEAALKRGDKVAATARNLASIADLREKYGENVLTLELDVTKPEQVKSAVTQAYTHFGRLKAILYLRCVVFMNYLSIDLAIL